MTPGKVPQFVQLGEGVDAYKMDWNNWAPSVGFNWAPTVEGGLLRTMMGQPGDFAIRGGFARAYQRNGLNDFTGFLNENPGVAIAVTRSQGIGNLGPLPQLLRNPDSLRPASFPDKPAYPLTDVQTQDVNVFDPNFQVPYADTYSFGVQRGLTRTMAFEIRYVGSRSREQVATYNLNEVNIHENGFLNEFKLAQANLLSHISSGCGLTGAPACSFAFRGAGTGTSPLPIYLAYLNGSRDSGTATAYAGGNWTSATFVNPLARLNPNPLSAANTLDDDAGRRTNAIAAGLARNFLVANPDYLGGADLRGNGGYTRFNGLQMELRRRLANGFSFQSSYAYGPSWTDSFYSFRVDRQDVRQSGGEGEVTHAFKLNWVFELPFGQGKRWAIDVNGVWDRIIGGWQIHGNARVQSGRLVDFGNVRMVGFNEDGAVGLDVQAPDRHRPPRVDAAPGRHRRDDQGLQRQRDVGHRVRIARRAEREVLRAGERCRLRRDDRQQPRQLRHPHAHRARPDVQGSGHQRHEGHPDRGPGESRVPRRDAERLQLRQLRPRGRRRQHPRELRSGRPHGHQHVANHAVGDARDLVDTKGTK